MNMNTFIVGAPLAFLGCGFTEEPTSACDCAVPTSWDSATSDVAAEPRGFVDFDSPADLGRALDASFELVGDSGPADRHPQSPDALIDEWPDEQPVFVWNRPDAPVDRPDASRDSGVRMDVVQASLDAGGCRPSECGTHSWACWPMPEAPESALPNATTYTDLGDATVRDEVTCLRWQKDVTRSSTARDWASANEYCASLNLLGVEGWRLPTRIELVSLVNTSRNTPAISLESFPSTPPLRFWTSSIAVAPAAPATPEAWWVEFQSGETGTAGQDTWFMARCVQGNGDGDLVAVLPPNLYSRTAVDEIEDNYTSLIWQQGQSPTPMRADEAAHYCAELMLNGHTWRLPTMKELTTLVDDTRVTPAINMATFPGTDPTVPYWTSTQFTTSRTQGTWSLSFETGRSSYVAISGLVRCVR